MIRRLAVLASHEGTNLQAIIDACETGQLPAVVALVISNNSQSGAIKRAVKHRIDTLHVSSATHPDPDDRDEAMLNALDSHAVDYIVTAGYMKKLHHRVLTRYAHRIFNTHPSLLPKYGGQGMFGLRVHEAVLAAGDTQTGVTIHEVNQHYDEGDIVDQTKVPVLPDDTPRTLATRVQACEHRFLVETLTGIVGSQDD